MKQVHIVISGNVQGVGFRQFIKQHARKRGLTGWVKNTSDGKVETIIQGAKDQIEELIEFCKKGPFLADVKGVEVTGVDTDQEYSSFDTLL